MIICYFILNFFIVLYCLYDYRKEGCFTGEDLYMTIFYLFFGIPVIICLFIWGIRNYLFKTFPEKVIWGRKK